MLSVVNNILAMNAANCLKTNVDNKAKATEKLSSGYRINRAADDAAGLVISEKMRAQIRGLNQGTRNATEGISWCQTGDGALGEVHALLQRMNELAVQSVNGTYTDEERSYMEMELRELKEEIDRIGNTTEFNTLKIFEEYEGPYCRIYGSVRWEPSQVHVITDGTNDLEFTYRNLEGAAQHTVKLTVPPGEYTTEELLDIINTELCGDDPAKGTFGDDLMKGPSIEYTPAGFCNALLQGGEVIDSVSGGLSYLIYPMYQGGELGALIGTTSFPNDYDRLQIVAGKNDFMSFTIQDFDGNSSQKSITIPANKDGYTRSELIDILNDQLKDTDVKASARGTGIMLSGEDKIVTGFKGNMFKIDNKDEGGKIYNSVFYDNVQYGNTTKYPAVLTGAPVLPTDTRDAEHSKFIIKKDANDTLTLQPNGMDSSVALTIPEGEYTIEQMKTKLNELFTANGLDLTASEYSQSVRDAVSGRYYTFSGLRITSGVKGLESKVNIDPVSSAFNTLFKTREYNDYVSYPDLRNERDPDVDGYFKGTKAFPSGITLDGTNNQFQISVNVNDGKGGTTAKTCTITMSQTTYADANAIRAELITQLGSSDLKGLLDVTVSNNGTISLTGASGKQVNTIRAYASGSNKGYDAVFVGHRTEPVYNSVNGANVTLQTSLPSGGLTADSSITIQLGDDKQTVDLSKGDTQADIEQKIEAAFPPSTTVTPNTFPPVSGKGTVAASNSTTAVQGSESTKTWNGKATGTTILHEGTAEIASNYAASLLIEPKLQDNMVLDSSNNKISLTLNGTTQEITLTEGTYSQDSLVEELQKQVDEKFGTGWGGAVVTREGNNLIITSRLPAGYRGSNTSIACSTGSSSFFKDLNTTKKPAEFVSSMPLLSSMTIDGSNNNNIFSFEYTENGTTQTVDLELSGGTYSQAGMIRNIQTALDKTDTGIKASISNGRLVLTSEAEGSGVSISYTQNKDNKVAQALFGTKDTPADMVVNRQIQSSITIDGTSNQFSIVVNGTRQPITLKDGTYSREGFKNMLNTKLSSIGVEAYLTNGRLGFRTKDSGNVSLSMDYANGGSSMVKIYGETTVKKPGIDASFTPDGRLQMKSTDGTTKIYVNTTTGGALMQPGVRDVTDSPDYNSGYHSQIKSKLDGQKLDGSTVTIDQWNNDLSFYFRNGTTTKFVTLEVPGKDEADKKKEYSFDELKNYLQGELDRRVGAGVINVTVDGTGVMFEAAKPGNQYQFSNFDGDFYDKILCRCEERTVEADETNKDGSQKVDPAFTVGRKDVKNNVTSIRSGFNDELSLDLTYKDSSNQDVVKTISIKLDNGDYPGDALKAHLQDKIDEELENMGLNPGLIKVGIGDKNTGVYGSNDANALNFSIAEDVSGPAEGRYIIDGVRGNAAFEFFYQTDGKMLPAYVIGTKDIGGGVTIEPENTDLSFKVDGTDYTITIPEGVYSESEILDKVNELFGDADIPLIATLEGDRMKVSYEKLGSHVIDEVSGSAKDDIFFDGDGKKEGEDDKYIVLSGQYNDRIKLPQHGLSVRCLRMNPLSISKAEYAQNALTKIANAIKRVSSIRSDYGSTQNRLEGAVRSNENKSENAQRAESLIRDADMAKEMVRFSTSSILEQAAQAMLAQANQIPQGVLTLLQ